MEHQAGPVALDIHWPATQAALADVWHHGPGFPRSFAQFLEPPQRRFEQQQIARQLFAFRPRTLDALPGLVELVSTSRQVALDLLGCLLFAFVLFLDVRLESAIRLDGAEQVVELRLDPGSFGDRSMGLLVKVAHFGLMSGDSRFASLELSLSFGFVFGAKMGEQLGLVLFGLVPGLFDARVGGTSRPSIQLHQHQDKASHGAEQDGEERERIGL